MKITGIYAEKIFTYYKDKRIILLFSSFVFLLILFHINVFGFTYQSDDHLRLNSPSSATTYLQQYRYMEAIASWLLELANTSPIHISTLSFIIYVLAYSLFSTIVVLLASDGKINFITFTISALICASPFMASILIFKSAILAQALGISGVLAYTVASITLHGWKKSIGAALGIFVALASYQPYLSVAAVTLFILIHSEIRIKGRITLRTKLEILFHQTINFIFGISLYISSIVLLGVFTTQSNIASRGGISSLDEIIDRIISINKWFLIPYGDSDPITSYYLKPILLSVFLLALISSLYRKKFEAALMGILIIIVCSITSVAPFLIFKTIWIYSRTQTAGILTISVCTLIMLQKGRLLHTTASILIFCAIVISASGTQKIYYEQWAINIEDRMRAFEIHNDLMELSKDNLEEYEIILNNSPWAFKNSSSTTYHDRSISALSVPWSAKSIFHLVTEKNLNIKVKRDTELCTHSKKWPDKGSIWVKSKQIYICF